MLFVQCSHWSKKKLRRTCWRPLYEAERDDSAARARVAARVMKAAKEHPNYSERGFDGFASCVQIREGSPSWNTSFLADWLRMETTAVLSPSSSHQFGRCRPLPREENVFSFESTGTNTQIKSLFKAVQSAFVKTGRPCKLDRYDLHHGHAFFSIEHGPGILFHRYGNLAGPCIVKTLSHGPSSSSAVVSIQPLTIRDFPSTWDSVRRKARLDSIPSETRFGSVQGTTWSSC
mmetsp:Transcript_45427/g.176621  ORF Transcript_45427/g.176621 Transcript_45427/m.176621 type:complete len:232 (-) Transcript_45427:7226-7921(-)